MSLYGKYSFENHIGPVNLTNWMEIGLVIDPLIKIIFRTSGNWLNQYKIDIEN